MPREVGGVIWMDKREELKQGDIGWEMATSMSVQYNIVLQHILRHRSSWVYFFQGNIPF